MTEKHIAQGIFKNSRKYIRPPMVTVAGATMSSVLSTKPHYPDK
ncbi:MAG TPA: hypothetical protein VF884_06260 [Nitrososphaeraceae archaeon]